MQDRAIVTMEGE